MKRTASVIAMTRVERLTSAQNPLFKIIRRARRAGTLTDDGYCLAEGIHLLEEAIRSRLPMKAVVVTRAALPAVRRLTGLGRIRVVETDEAVFAEMATTETPQGVLSLVRPHAWRLEEAFGPEALTLALDGVQDPGNAGAMIRAAEAFGASGVVFLKGSVSPFNPKAVRASAGSVFRMPVFSGASAGEFFAAAASLKVQVYVASPGTGEPADTADLVRACALVIGSEGQGLSEPFRRAAAVRIPTSGVESLNAAVAAAILLYEARRQRGGTG